MAKDEKKKAPARDIADQVVETAKTVREKVREKRLEIIDIPSPKEFFWNTFLGEDDDIIRVLQSAVEQANDVVLITDADFGRGGPRIVYVNPAFTVMTGYSREEVIGKNPAILQGPRTDSKMISELGRAIRKGEFFRGETINYRKDGSEYHVGWHISPVRDEDGAITHFISIQRDISNRREMEERLKRYTESLEEEVRLRTKELIQSEKMASLGLLVAGVAHEVNNPLAAIKANTGLLEEILERLEDDAAECRVDPDLYKEMRKLLETNRKGMERMATLTSTLKRFARPDTGQKEPADINQGLKDTLLILYNRFKNRVEVVTDYGEIPQVVCNIGQINQVFTNLILNAVEAMDTGRLTISTQARGRNVLVTIQDTGPGIPADILDRIFDPFFTTKAEGTGLGLSVAYRIIRDHNGDILVESESGQGTVMTIRLPISGGRKDGKTAGKGS